MGKPKHRRCATCNVVTSRYSHAQRSGPLRVAVWVRDAVHGEQVDRGTGRSYCNAHAVQTPVPSVPTLPMPPVTAGDLLARAAADERLDDDAFTALSRTLRSTDPVDGETEL